MLHHVLFNSNGVCWALAVLVVIAVSAAARVGQAGGPGAPGVMVSIVYRGVGGPYGHTLDECPGANRQGMDAMTGTLDQGGIDPDGAVQYKGVLARTTLLDLCFAKQTPDGDEWCTTRLTGSSKMAVTIDVDGDNRGAYVKAQAVKNAPVVKSAFGDCDPTVTDEARDAYPDDGMMSGIPFETVPTGPLRVGKWEVGNYTLEVSR